MPRRANIHRQRLRWLAIARLQNTGMGEDSIAACTGFSVTHVRLTLESPAYQEWVNARLSNAVSLIDSTLANDANAMRMGLRELVPLAIARLERALASPDDSIAIRACTEILDRDSRFTKAQNVQVTHQIVPAKEIESARKLARELRKHTIDLQPISQPLLVSDTEHKN